MEAVVATMPVAVPVPFVVVETIKAGAALVEILEGAPN
jgi:hypothetical protein